MRSFLRDEIALEFLRRDGLTATVRRGSREKTQLHAHSALDRTHIRDGELADTADEALLGRGRELVGHGLPRLTVESNVRLTWEETVCVARQRDDLHPVEVLV